ncbi:MAG: hypothetical protein HPY71_15040 [Firmicutes bacterium]|nr:hypothetical protein [Bacillota bacterium]
MKRSLLILTMLLLATVGLLVFSGMAAAEPPDDTKYHDVSVTVPVSLRLRLAGNVTFSLEGYPPDEYPATYGPTSGFWVKVHYNQSGNWQVRVVGPANFTGPTTKPISDLKWSTEAQGTYTAMSNTAATVFSGTAKTTGWAQHDVFYKLVLDGNEAAGTYTATITYILVTI